jgi:hypothetical protein
MASGGRDPSRGRDPKRTDIKKKIKDQLKIAEELQKDVDQGSLQFKELMTKARDLRKVFDELEKNTPKEKVWVFQATSRTTQNGTKRGTGCMRSTTRSEAT